MEGGGCNLKHYFRLPKADGQKGSWQGFASPIHYTQLRHSSAKRKSPHKRVEDFGSGFQAPQIKGATMVSVVDGDMNIVDSAANNMTANSGLTRLGARSQSCLTPFVAGMRSDVVKFTTVRTNWPS